MPGKDYHPRPAPLPQPLSVNYLSEDYIMQTCYSELSEGFKKNSRGMRRHKSWKEKDYKRAGNEMGRQKI